jgi:hypothetical protein
VIGLSEPRENRTFAGLALQDRLEREGVGPRCGLMVVDLHSGDAVHWLRGSRAWCASFTMWPSSQDGAGAHAVVRRADVTTCPALAIAASVLAPRCGRRDEHRAAALGHKVGQDTFTMPKDEPFQMFTPTNCWKDQLAEGCPSKLRHKTA